MTPPFIPIPLSLLFRFIFSLLSSLSSFKAQVCSLVSLFFFPQHFVVEFSGCLFPFRLFFYVILSFTSIFLFSRSLFLTSAVVSCVIYAAGSFILLSHRPYVHSPIFLILGILSRCSIDIPPFLSLYISLCLFFASLYIIIYNSDSLSNIFLAFSSYFSSLSLQLLFQPANSAGKTHAIHMNSLNYRIEKNCLTFNLI